MKAETQVRIPAIYKLYSGDVGSPVTIIAFVGVGSSNGDGSFNATVMALAMLPSGRLITKDATLFTVVEPEAVTA